MVYKCKICGGSLNINDESYIVCEYCGTKQTLPKLSDEKRAALYDRANYFRRSNEFDKAASLFEQILNEDNTDAEAYWSLVLCRYGIEYVEDPSTHKRIPTVNRAQFSSILGDKDYLSALKHANPYQAKIYEEEAVTIDEIQKGILSISNSEEPFDIFICYKETDENGRRTPDSVYAQDIYKALTEEGYKVFFSRITLEDKIGTAYEPYIFAALNSSKVMIALGTKPEYFNAVWVKNEWKRFLALINEGKKKTLIPAYRDMNPYDLPEEFAYIQAQDIGKIGFMQDLVHGINKIIPVKKSVKSSDNVESQMTDSMLDKAFNFLEAGDKKSAQLCLDTAFAYNSSHPLYYVALLLIKYDCKRIEELSKINSSIKANEDFISAIKNADDELKDNLNQIANHTIFNEAKGIFDAHKNIGQLEKAESLLAEIPYEKQLVIDADLAEQIKILSDSISEQLEALRLEEQKKKEAQEKLKEKLKQRAKTIKKVSVIAAISLAVISIVFSVVYFAVMPSVLYSNASEYKENNDVENAISTYSKIRRFKDSSDLIFELEEATLRYCHVGGEVSYGAYKTNGGFGRQKIEPIKWIVLARDSEKALLISKDCLTAMPYNSLEKISWKDSELNTWLNQGFVSDAFTDNEKNNLLVNDSTNSNVFILNSFEIKEYLSDSQMQAKATNFAKSKGIQVAENGYSCWWVRNDASTDQIQTVLSTGKIGAEKLYPSNDFVGVRPAVWVKLNLSAELKGEYEENIRKQKYDDSIELYNAKKYSDAMKSFESIIDYRDSKDYYYSSRLALAINNYVEGNYTPYINELVDICNGGYEPAKTELEKIQSEIYSKAKKEYAATNWKTAKEIFVCLESTQYKDSIALMNKCEANIKSERNRYNGIWLHPSNWTHIKIDENGVFTGDDTDLKRNEWAACSYTYDENTGKMTFTWLNGNKYDISVSGNKLTIKWTNARDEYDVDWFGGTCSFSRQ